MNCPILEIEPNAEVVAKNLDRLLGDAHVRRLYDAGSHACVGLDPCCVVGRPGTLWKLLVSAHPARSADDGQYSVHLMQPGVAGEIGLEAVVAQNAGDDVPGLAPPLGHPGPCLLKGRREPPVEGDHVRRLRALSHIEQTPGAGHPHTGWFFDDHGDPRLHDASRHRLGHIHRCDGHQPVQPLTQYPLEIGVGFGKTETVRVVASLAAVEIAHCHQVDGPGMAGDIVPPGRPVILHRVRAGAEQSDPQLPHTRSRSAAAPSSMNAVSSLIAASTSLRCTSSMDVWM